ncbi:hypothetical protein ACVD22_004263 [Vibrio vulnificus]
MNIGIDFTWLAVTTIAMVVIAIITGKKTLETLKDMVSQRIYVSGLFMTSWLLLICVAVSNKNLPDAVFLYGSKFVSAVVGMFLAVVVAKVIVDIRSGVTKLTSKKTFLGLFVVFITIMFVQFVDHIPDLKNILSEHMTQQTLEDEALSLNGDLLIGLVIFLMPFVYVKKALPLLGD